MAIKLVESTLISSYGVEVAVPQNWYPKDSDQASFGLNKQNENKSRAKKLLRFASQKPSLILAKLGTSGEGNLWLIKSPPNDRVIPGNTRVEYGLVDTANEHLLYFASVNTFKLNGYKAATQCLIWSAASTSGIKLDTNINLTRFVFFASIFSDHDVIISDSIQSDAGRRFWMRTTQEAFAMNLPVYLYDFRVGNFERVKGINSNDATIWSDSEDYKNIRLAIAKQML